MPEIHQHAVPVIQAEKLVQAPPARRAVDEVVQHVVGDDPGHQVAPRPAALGTYGRPAECEHREEDRDRAPDRLIGAGD
jgi:hypothetical protein